MGSVCDLSLLLGLAWPGCCVGGAKREVGSASFVAGISSQGPGMLGSPWEAALGRFLLAEPCFAGRGRRGCFGPMGSKCAGSEEKHEDFVWFFMSWGMGA